MKGRSDEPRPRHHVRARRRRRPPRVGGGRHPSGLPAFTIVGLADKAVREARERVRAAIVNSGFEFPQKRITVNLAPAYLRKIGPRFDLPLAIALLAASGAARRASARGLRGRGRAVAGRRAAARSAARWRSPRARGATGSARLVLPASRAREAALVEGIEILGVGTLRRGRRRPARRRAAARPLPRGGCEPDARARPEPPDLSDVRGHNALLPRARGRGGRAATTSSCTGRRAPARRCSPGGVPVDPAAARARGGDRGHAHPVDRRPARGRRAARARGRSARRTTRSRPRAWSAAARSRCRARRRSPTTASCSSTSCRSSRARASRRCASRSRTAASPSSAASG